MASLNFKGKSAVWNHHLSVPYHVLEKDKKNSLKGKNEDENLIIEGDNLLALKALLPKYQGKIRCIYIDPPYNTGEEGWEYNDNVNNPLIKTWIGETVGKEGEDLNRHDKWLCMITPRLKLLRELLSEDGLIFMSIDENEAHHLRSISDEIFSTKNFLGNFIWQSRTSISDDKEISLNHNQTFVYSKNREQIRFKGYELDKTEYSNPDNDPRGPWKLVPIDANKPGGDTKYEIINPKTGEVFLPSNNRSWAINKESFDALLRDGRIAFGKSGDARPQRKLFWEERQEQGDTKTPSSLILNAGTTKDGTEELTELFGKKIFSYPKPVSFVKTLLSFIPGNDYVVLDSFAGSGSTADAVINLNNDGGTRKFILIQLPETLSEKTQAKEAGYDYVHEITRDRVKKVIERDNLDIGFTYYKLGPSIDGKKLIEGKDMPSWESLSKYIYNLATGKAIDDVTLIKSTWQIKGTDVYLIYKDSIEELKNLAITRDWLESVKDKEGKKIVYAPACFLDKETLDEYNISFVQIPFNLFTRT